MSEHSQTVFEELEQAGVLAVLTIDKAADAAPLAQALLAGGVRAMELTLRTPAALEAIEAVRTEAPEMIVGAGTVLTPEQIEQVAEVGARFAVSPGFNPNVLLAAKQRGVPFAPGIVTPSDIEAALEFGCRVLKLFPCEASGGLPYLRNIAAPYNHLGLKYIPLGGVKQSNLAEYLSEPLVAAVGGSWLAPQDAVTRGDWQHIEELSKAASETVRAVRSGGDDVGG